METKDVSRKSVKRFIIANPIYDTVFKRLMENQRIAKFFISAILEQPIEDLQVLPQEFSYKLDETKVPDRDRDRDKGKEKGKDKGKDEKEENAQYFYAFFRLDFIATIRDSKGNHSKILIELQKSWETLDVIRFRKYLGEQYKRVDIIDGKETVLPITTIYILGNNLAEIDCPCIKVDRTYTDMLNKKPINAKSKFIENLTHNSYVIQAGRITDVRYTTNLDKLLSIFEQRYFIKEDSVARKEYPYQPDDEDMTLITDLLYEIGADPKEQKQIEDEEEALRIINNVKDPLKRSLEEKEKTIEEQAKSLEEQAKSLEEKDKTIEESKKKLEEQAKKIAEMERLLQDKQIE
ncbi:MAG: hypothetical protein LBC19_02230 [Tannerella sp.]|jgi:hypothetical protein|nr:hypothetical protein [Tannerella sp.]